MEIEIKGTHIEDIRGWVDLINQAFQLDEIELFQSERIVIRTKSPFIPIHMLILLWHYIFTIENKRKVCVFEWPIDVWNFIYHCWLQDFINTATIDKWKLPDSVILPFSRLTKAKDLQNYLENFASRVEFDLKFEISDHIWELHDNAVVHWGTQDIYIMWQHYPRKWRINIVVYDAWKWMIQDKYEEYIQLAKDEYATDRFYQYVKKTFGTEAFFIILCVCTSFSTRWKQGWMWLQELSKFLFKNNWVICITTWKIFTRLKFKTICSKIDVDSMDIQVTEITSKLRWTHISFSFSI